VNSEVFVGVAEECVCNADDIAYLGDHAHHERSKSNNLKRTLEDLDAAVRIAGGAGKRCVPDHSAINHFRA